MVEERQNEGYLDQLQRGMHQFMYTLLAFPRAWRFIRHYELWKGMKEYKWVYRFLLFVAGLAGLYLFNEYSSWRNSHQEAGVMNMFVGGDSFLWNISQDTYESISGGMLKWVILILLEVVIYHFMRSTIKILLKKEEQQAASFKPFMDAQIRMLVVSGMAYGLELAITAGVFGAFFGIFSSLRWLQPIAVLIVQCLLLGFAIVDNYNEQFKLEISQSYRYTRMGYLGVCLGLGLPLFFILKIPFIGAVAGPILAAVTAAIVMKELSDLHTVGYVPSEKELKKIGKKKSRRRRKEMRSEH